MAGGEKEEIPVATTVIIPCRNEATTIGPIVETFQQHDATNSQIYVILDRATTDETGANAREAGANVFQSNVHGKGQVVREALRIIVNMSEDIILCDGDYTGLTTDHIQRLLCPPRRKHIPVMVVGVPDFPDCEVPAHVTTAWPFVSGFRHLHWTWIPINAHGYLLESQINKEIASVQGIVQHVFMPGLKSPFQWPLTERRMAALQADRNWGKRNGVF